MVANERAAAGLNSPSLGWFGPIPLDRSNPIAARFWDTWLAAIPTIFSETAVAASGAGAVWLAGGEVF